MSDVTGVARLRRAIENQASLGEASFSLPVAETRAICDECEDELARVSWAQRVPAPVDADGEVVPLTTRVMYGDDGRELEVCSFKLWNEPYAMQWRASCTNKDGSMGYADVSNIHLTCPDSWERLEEDVKRFEDDDSACSYFCNELRICNGCRSPSHIGFNCRNGVARDVLRRAKALAERDANGSER